MPTLTHKRSQEKLLEDIIDKRIKRDDARKLRESKSRARREQKEARNKVSTFRKEFRSLFARFRKLTRCRFDNIYTSDAFFTYRGDKWSISFEKWTMGGESADPDDYVTEGMHWSLRHWNGGYAPRGTTIIDAREVKPGKDYSNKVITLLREHEEAPYTGRI